MYALKKPILNVMQTESLTDNHNSVLASPNSEQFSYKLAIVLISIHLLALPALFFVTKENIAAWFLTHIYFGTIGASIGLHRLFSHRSFTPSPVLKNIIAVTATLCFQGGPIFWAATHRVHHLFSESFGDPHSAKRGFLWSHFGWMLYSYPNGFSYLKAIRLTSDLRKDRTISYLEINSTKINIAFLILLFLICLTMHRIELFFWIGPLRIVTVWHATWMVNSYAHRAPLFNCQKSTQLRNSLLLSIIIGGDGDHEFHHRHPTSICHSDKKFHFDYGYWLLCVWKKLGWINFRPVTHFYENKKNSVHDADFRENSLPINKNHKS
jgi:fatty-acid desaturase